MANQNPPRAEEALLHLDELVGDLPGSRKDHSYRQLCSQVIAQTIQLQREYINELRGTLEENEITVPEPGEKKTPKADQPESAEAKPAKKQKAASKADTKDDA